MDLDMIVILIFVSVGLSVASIIALIVTGIFDSKDKDNMNETIRNLQNHTQELEALMNNRFQNVTNYIQNTNQELRNELLSHKMNSYSKPLFSKKSKQLIKKSRSEKHV